MPKTRLDILQKIEKANANSQSHISLRNWDLSGLDLSGLYLSHVDLYGANLEGANLAGTYLKGANLSCANLKNTNLSGAYLQGANLQFSNLEDTNFCHADLRKVDFRDVQTFNGARFKGSCAIGAWFGTGDLRNTDIHHSNFYYEYLSLELQEAMKDLDDDPLFTNRDENPQFESQDFLPSDFNNLKNKILEKCIHFQEIDRDATFTVPNFIRYLTEEQRTKFLDERDRLIDCSINLEEISVPVHIAGESANYNRDAFQDYLANSEVSPFTGQAIHEDSIQNDYSPQTYIDYHLLVEEMAKCLPADELAELNQQQVPAAPPALARHQEADIDPNLLLIIYLTLDKYGLSNAKNLEKALKNPARFLEQYNELKQQQFCKAVYLQEVLDAPNLYNPFTGHVRLFKSLSDLDLASPNNIQRLLKAPLDTTLIKILIESGLDESIKDCKQRNSTEKLKLSEFFKYHLQSETELAGLKSILNGAASALNHRRHAFNIFSTAHSYKAAEPYFNKARKLANISDRYWEIALSRHYWTNSWQEQANHYYENTSRIPVTAPIPTVVPTPTTAAPQPTAQPTAVTMNNVTITPAMRATTTPAPITPAGTTTSPVPADSTTAPNITPTSTGALTLTRTPALNHPLAPAMEATATPLPATTQPAPIAPTATTETITDPAKKITDIIDTNNRFIDALIKDYTGKSPAQTTAAKTPTAPSSTVTTSSNTTSTCKGKYVVIAPPTSAPDTAPTTAPISTSRTLLPALRVTPTVAPPAPLTPTTAEFNGLYFTQHMSDSDSLIPSFALFAGNPSPTATPEEIISLFQDMNETDTNNQGAAPAP
ncbi:hypothetical protein AVI51_03955 [Piscirickettsia salmonis]|uniref:Type III effector pipB2 n=1 Tax=Piscirickettsia salmonis TaxID=1238 RepID=A0A9Q6LLM1_PISSA|nr:pentapeptide repeat-containing protein [Piscirickettsia salmonis]ALA25233.1 pentapeptide repeats family protein [Piscirickettsia salmonis]APS45491.1 hypothetical protein AVI48_14675 [Piscirickettsia salmonis]APS48852.1 hypothetical protein AVI49_15290 [Piscirickettsia salmonis]APS50086.1 hypothetical protein AVI50_03995 [Piscirickettsia salmonis]APS53286.1 hypothetical protein AVI51_03955 [Piscirickettsia salmonis]